MSMQWKQRGAALLVSFLTVVREGMRWLYVGARWMFGPLRLLERVLFRYVFVRLYAGALLLRRVLRRALGPVKSKAIFLIANKYVVHLSVIALAFAVSVSSVRARETDNIDTGDQTLLFRILSQGDPSANVTVQDTTPPVYQPAGVNYLGSGVIRSVPDIDFDDQAFIPSTFSTVGAGNLFIGPQGIGTTGKSLAPREKVVEYVVQEGDTIGSIAGDHQISVRTILLANNMGQRDILRIGQRLKILPVDGLLHTVKKGDTLEQIARRYTADAREMLVANRLSSASELRIGEELIVPNGEPPAPPPQRIANVPRPIAPIGSIFRPQGVSGKTGTRLLWPTAGRAITQYYGVWEHVHGWRIHAGIDIDGTYSSPIYAAEDGIVTVSGWGTGYGYHVDIDHGGGMVTRYAHASKLFVKPGQQVARGEVIAMVGTTGYSTGTHVHFEVRIGGRPVNPISYIR